jgi:subtilisin family serine protease
MMMTMDSRRFFRDIQLLLVLVALLSHSVQAEIAESIESVDGPNGGLGVEQHQKVVIGFISEEARESYWASMLEQNTANANTMNTVTQPRSVSLSWSSSSSSSSEHEGHRRLFRYSKSPALAMSLSAQQASELANDPRVAYVRPEVQLKLLQSSPSDPPTPTIASPLTEEIVPYGIQAVQATSSSIPPPPSLLHRNGTCDNLYSFKVCVVDTGLFVAHKDIPYDVNGGDIKGVTIGLWGDPDWFNPSPAASHGTHITGTILAQANNGIGVRGVLPSKQGICLLVARTYDEFGYQDSSIVSQAMEWCGSQGAKVINLSAGAPFPLLPADEETYHRLVYEDGVLIVAAAGNDGTNTLFYPASLDSVISVGATNQTLGHAAFSQFNDQVDLVAPGFGVLSTVSSNAIRINNNNNNTNQTNDDDGEGTVIQTSLMQYSLDAPSELWNTRRLTVVNCGSGFSNCTDAQNKMCLIVRGGSLFTEKAINCQNGGGIAALIYNNVPGPYGGSLTDNDNGLAVKIPVFAIAQEDGRLLMNRTTTATDATGGGGGNTTTTTTVTILPPRSAYRFLDGTSMAAPHVTGIAARIWAARPACTNLQIREALEQSALDLGVVGKDPKFGHGLVQAQAAFEYVRDTFDPPCGGNTTTEQQPSQCLENFTPCQDPLDCCSGRCVPTTYGGPKACRATPKAGKEKLGGTNRGGAAAASSGPTRTGGTRRRRLRNLKGNGSVTGTTTTSDSSAPNEWEDNHLFQDVDSRIHHSDNHRDTTLESVQPRTEGVATQ